LHLDVFEQPEHQVFFSNRLRNKVFLRRRTPRLSESRGAPSLSAICGIPTEQGFRSNSQKVDGAVLNR
jgi:hypothetical protein